MPIGTQYLQPGFDLQKSSLLSFPCSQPEKFTQSLLQAQDPQSDPALSSLFFPTQLKLNSLAVNQPSFIINVHGLSPADKIIHQEFTKRSHWHHGDYPEPDLERSLLDLYFKNIHPYLPILHPGTFMEDLQSGLAHTDESFRALCMIMMALSSRFSEDPRVFSDLEGNPLHSPQMAGLRFAFVIGPHLARPTSAPANIHDLQAIFLSAIYTLGTTSPDSTWSLVGLGLQRAQEAGFHFEKNPKWSNSPIQDHLRRKAFTMLDQLDCFLSLATGRPTYMQESDFDVLPHDLDFETTIGTFTNPFDQSPMKDSTSTSEKTILSDLCVAHCALKSSFAGIKNLFALIDVMSVHKKSHPSVNFSSCIEVLINQLDTSMTKCYEEIAQKFSKYESSIAGVTDSQLVSSVTSATCYYQFRLLMHKLLFNFKGSKSISREHSAPISTDDQKVISKMAPKHSHAEVCIESARMIITLINRLHQRNLLQMGFYWIPLRITSALLILIASIKKFGKNMSTNQCNRRHHEISLGIQMLDALAPSTFLAERCSKAIAPLLERVLQQHEKKKNLKTNPSSASSSPAMPSSTSTSSANDTSSSPKTVADKDPNVQFSATSSFTRFYSDFIDSSNLDINVETQDLDQYISF